MDRNGIMYACLIVAILFLTGCEQRQAGNSKGWDDDLTANEILSTVVTEYGKAESYSDKGVLYLSYRMNGRWIQEPQPYSTAWTLNNQYAANLFNTQIRCDGHDLSCYVFDIDSGNLDNQHMLVPVTGKIPLAKAVHDKIASHFVKGFSEMPIDETQKHLRPDLLPAVVGLLTDLTDVGWLKVPEKLSRLPDQTYQEQECFVLKMEPTCGTFNVWIDKITGVIHQIELPIQYLDSRVLASSEISDLSLVAQFHEAKLNPVVDLEAFAVKDRSASTLVRHFVSIPEPFPCELIGEKAPDFGLNETDNRMVARMSFNGKTTSLAWLGDEDQEATIRKFDDVRGKFDNENFHFGIVYSDSHLADPLSTKTNDLTDELKAFISDKQIQTKLYCDREMNAATMLKMKTVPSVLVFDAGGKIHFSVSTAEDNWHTQLEAATKRVAKGEDVAAEMKQEYQAFLDSYYEQLLAASAKPSTKVASTPVPAGARDGAPIKPEKIWTSSAFTKPGNMIAAPRDGGVYVLDGWRTVCRLDTKGDVVQRIALDIPENHAINQLRMATDSKGQNQFAGFSMLGKKAFVFNEAWKPIAEFPSDDKQHRGISDCKLGDYDNDSQLELRVAFADDNGIKQFETSGNNEKVVFGAPSKSFVELGNTTLAVSGNRIVNANSKKDVLSGLKFRRLQRAANVVLAIGTDEGGNWELAGIGTDLKRSWTARTSSQFFENELDSLSVLEMAGRVIIAVAGNDNSIEFLSGSGNLLGSVDFDNTLHGICLVNIEGIPAVVVSHENRVECWKLTPNRMASRTK